MVTPPRPPFTKRAANKRRPARNHSSLQAAAGLALAILSTGVAAQDGAQERAQDKASPYRIVDLPQPPGVHLEVGGLALGDGTIPDGENTLLIATRRGEIWRVADVYGETPQFTLWAEGLHEPLGLLAHDGWIYASQRGELSRLRDRSGDGRADLIETVSSGWDISGNYHEYCFGPARTPDGAFWLTLNKPFGAEPFGKVDWRGWAVRITADGTFQPVAAGLRSPAGIETSPWGEPFYTDNQGEWCASGKFAPLAIGDFHGHPHGIESCHRPESLVAHPGSVPNGKTIDVVADQIETFRLPAVWIPYDRLGRSPAGFVWDQEGHFGPYQNQVFVADQYSSEVFRITIEKVQGRWQGACYPFVAGLKCGITRVLWGRDGSLICGMTERGWPALGDARDGVQRIVWDGSTSPFDLLETTALPNGFRLKFTAALDPKSVDLEGFDVTSWTYFHHSTYGSKEVDRTALTVQSAVLTAPDTVEIVVQGMADTRVHHLQYRGLKRASDGAESWHHDAYYTRNASPKPQ